MARILDREVGPIGYGMMGLSWRTQPPPLEQAISALKAALDSGMNLWNGAEFYGTPEYNSMTILKAYFTKYPADADKVVLCIKGGMNPQTFKADGTAAGTRRSLDNIISQLGGVKKLDLWAPGRRDADTPLSETFATAQKEYIDTGKLGGISMSEAGVETINEAAKYAKIAAIELELSIFSPDILTNGIAAACGQHNIAIQAYSPQGRGLLTGKFTKQEDFKNHGLISSFPRLQQDAIDHNMKLVNQVEALASAKGCTPGQMAIAWVRKHSNRPSLPAVIPIPGATTPDRVKENAKIIDLTDDEFVKINEIIQSFEVKGERYPGMHGTNT